MDIYWVKISGIRIDICCLVKVRGYLYEAEKEQQRISRKSCLFLQVILILKKKWFLGKLIIIFLTFSFNTFHYIVVLNYMLDDYSDDMLCYITVANDYLIC